jgi:shikimate kinase
MQPSCSEPGPVGAASVARSQATENAERGTEVRIYITGVACIGKTSIGRKLAEFLGVRFFDLDHEIETFFGTTIERLQNKFLTTYSFRKEAAKALIHLMKRPDSMNCVIALPPSGLMLGYLQVVKKSTGIVVALSDKPENILERITFYDIDSKQIEKILTAKEKRLYLKEIKKDITYFGKTYKRAHLQVDISGLKIEQAALKVKKALEAFDQKARERAGSE